MQACVRLHAGDLCSALPNADIAGATLCSPSGLQYGPLDAGRAALGAWVGVPRRTPTDHAMPSLDRSRFEGFCVGRWTRPLLDMPDRAQHALVAHLTGLAESPSGAGCVRVERSVGGDVREWRMRCRASHPSSST